MTMPEMPAGVDLGSAGRKRERAAANGNGARSLGMLLGGDNAIAEKKNSVGNLIKHFTTTHRLIHNAGVAYAVPASVTGATGAPGVAQEFGAGLRRKIVNMARVNKTLGVINKAAAETVMLNLEAGAFSGPETPLGLRFYQAAPDRIYLDLGREDGKCVEIKPDGWRILERLPSDVIFRRSHTIRELPIPIRGGRLDTLAPLLAMEPDSRAFKLLVGWSLGLPFDASVRPGVLVTGPPGCGKSTRLRLVVSLWEPAGTRAFGPSFGHNADDDQVRALHRAVPLWDNLSSVSQGASDALCCLITGMAREGRTLYSNADLSSHPICRPVGLTAVAVPAGLRPDALDRLIPVEVAPVAERIEDAEVQSRFEAAHPWLLGAALDAVAAALLWRNSVVAPTAFRMASYAKVLAAIDVAANTGALLGCPSGLLDTYAATLREARQATAAEDAFGGPLIALLEDNQRQAVMAIGLAALKAGHPQGFDLVALEASQDAGERARAAVLVRSLAGEWKGKASELLVALERSAFGVGRTPIDRKAPGWPSSPRRVPEVLAHLKDGLAELGVTWEISVVRGSTRYSFTLRDGVCPE